MESLKNVRKRDLASRIHKRLDKLIKKQDIEHALDIICQELPDFIAENNSVSIKNFGTFSPYIYRGYFSKGIHTGETHWYKPFWTVKFHPHLNLTRLIKAGKEKFKKKKKTS